MSLFDRLNIDRSVADELSFNPYYISAEQHQRGRFAIDTTTYLDFASNDYLGLSADPRVISAAAQALERFGASLCGTPIATGNSSSFAELSNRLAGFTGVEASVLFPSCFQANTSLFPSIANKDDVILIDHYAHASLIQGVKSVGCRIMPFMHNNCDHLEKLLRKCSGYREIFVVTESVFSTEGTIAPFDRILELCNQYNAIPVIDDSHGIGVLGENGRGVLEHFNICSYNGIYTASLGKALANSGGMIGGSQQLIDYLSYSSPGLIYSTALTPAIVGGLHAVLDIIDSEYPQLRTALYDNNALIRKALLEKGFQLADGSAPIISVQCGAMKETISLAKKFYDNGMLTTPFVEPSVAVNKGVVRVIPGAGIPVDKCEAAAEMIGCF